MGIRTRFITTAAAFAVALSGLVVGGATQAQAVDKYRVGDWKLVAGPRIGECYDWEAHCGPALFLRTAVLPNEDEDSVDVTGSLVGPDGYKAKFEYGSMSIISGVGSNVYDNSYWGQAASWDTKTGTVWKPGKYKFTVKMSELGVWWCSEHNPDGCTWFDPWSITKVYEFNYTGSRITVSQTKMKATKAPVVRGTRKAGSKLTAKPATWATPVMGTKPSTLRYRWMRNGKDISGATKSTYTLKSSDKGKKVSVRIRGQKSGYISATTTSSAVTVAR